MKTRQVVNNQPRVEKPIIIHYHRKGGKNWRSATGYKGKKGDEEEEKKRSQLKETHRALGGRDGVRVIEQVFGSKSNTKGRRKKEWSGEVTCRRKRNKGKKKRPGAFEKKGDCEGKPTANDVITPFGTRVGTRKGFRTLCNEKPEGGSQRETSLRPSEGISEPRTERGLKGGLSFDQRTGGRGVQVTFEKLGVGKENSPLLVNRAGGGRQMKQKRVDSRGNGMGKSKFLKRGNPENTLCGGEAVKRRIGETQ